MHRRLRERTSRWSLSGSSTCHRRSAGGLPVAGALVTLILAYGVARATGLEPLGSARSLSQYMRDRWTTESGFPGGPVYAITQTADGYLWIGAEKGLVRFDGLTFRLLDPGSQVGAGPAVLGVAGAPDGSLWARVRGTALVRYHNGVFQNLLRDIGASGSVVTAMLRGRDDAMLLATLGSGAMAYRGGHLASVATTRALPSSSFAVSIAEASDGA